MTTLAELRALADGAPSWKADDPDPQYGDFGWYISGWPLGETDDTEPGRATARLYGALNPEVVKALVAVAEAAEKDIPTPRVRRALDALKAVLG